MEVDLYSPLPTTAATRPLVGLKRFVPRDLSGDVVLPPPPPPPTSETSKDVTIVAPNEDAAPVDRRISARSYVQAMYDEDDDVEDVVVDTTMGTNQDFSFEEDFTPIVLTMADDVDAVARPVGRSFTSFRTQGDPTEEAKAHSTSVASNLIQADVEEQVTSTPLPNHSLGVIQAHSFRKEYTEYSSATRKKAALAGAINANRLATLFESMLFSPSSIQYASKWSPRDNDVVISSSIGAGESLLERIVRGLFATEQGMPLQQVGEEETTAPWLECSLVTEDPSVLIRNQGSSVQGVSRRIFRTTLSHSNLSMKINANKEARFIGLFRNPLHLRQAFMEQLKSFYVHSQKQLHPDTTEEVWATQFSRNVSFADIVNTPITLLQTTFHNATKQYLEYEYNLRDWLENTQSERQDENRMIVFFEELVANPAKLVEDVARFLGIDVTLEQVQAIVETVCNTRVLGELSRTSSFICPSSTGAPGPVDSTEFRKKMLTTPFTVSQRDALLVKSRWKDVLVGRAESYEQLFEKMTKSKYPHAKSLKLGRRSLAIHTRATSSASTVKYDDQLDHSPITARKRTTTYHRRQKSGSSSLGPRKSNLAKASTTSDETADDEDGEVDAKLDDEAGRSRTKSHRFTTFMGRLFS